MIGDKNKKSSSDIKRSNSKTDIRLDSDDFSTSMAKLAELAAQGIVTEEKEDNIIPLNS